MRPLEIALVALNLLILAALVTSRQRVSLITALVALTLPLIAGHLAIEGYRWQMLPIFALTAIALLLLIALRRPDFPARAITTLLAVSAALMFVGVLALILLPVPRLPRPPGPYAIGTFNLTWQDDSRMGVYAADPAEPRRLNVQVWYPSDAPGNRAHQRQLKWVPDGPLFGRAMTTWVGLPPLLLDQVGLIDTHTYADLPLAEAESAYPVVIYVHGWGGTRNINQDQIEALASSGYIVVSADHTYGALVTQFPDGRTVPYNPEALPTGIPDAEEDRLGNILILTFAADVRFMLDQLEALNADGSTVVSGHMDLDRIGVFGHSTGGGAAMVACSEDARCKAVLGMDTWIRPLGEDFVEGGLDQPAMLINSETWSLERNRPVLEMFYGNLRGEKTWLTVTGSGHYDFVMVPLFSPLAVPLKLKGPISGARMTAIDAAYLLAFFDHTLKGEDSALLGGVSGEWPEVTFRRGE
jgi:predicted dienelactone hydrolase